MRGFRVVICTSTAVNRGTYFFLHGVFPPYDVIGIILMAASLETNFHLVFEKMYRAI